MQGDKIVNYVQLDVQKLMETLKQALPDDDPLPAELIGTLRSFRGFHAKLYEWKEVHKVLNDVLFVFDQFSREVERRDASGQPGDLRSLARAWRPVKQKIDLLRDAAAALQYISHPLVESAAGRQGPPWVIEILSAADRLADLLDDAQINFDMHLIPYEGNDDWVQPTINEIKKILDSDVLADPNPDCDYCKYWSERKKVTQE